MTTDGAAAAAAHARLLRLLGAAVVIGPVAAVIAALFTAADHELQHLLWQSLPSALGTAEPPGWLVVGLLVCGAVLVSLAVRLPGHGGHSPLDGLAFDIGPAAIGSVLLAALASLSFGAVLGPEAPLLAIGTSIAWAVARKSDPMDRQILMFAGATAGMGTIFGNPLITAILVLEALLLSGRAAAGAQAAMAMMVPVLVALGAGYLMDVGLGSWTGLPSSSLQIPGLPDYPSAQVVDLLTAVPLALIVALLVVASLRAGSMLRRMGGSRTLGGLLVGAVIVAGAALLVRGVTGEPVDAVLFSGQAQLPQLVGLTTFGTVALIAVAKAVAYAASMGSGFRGGAIFPAVYIGTAAAVALHLVVTDTNLAAMAAAGIAAATAATIRMPFTAVLMAVLLCIAAGGAVTVTAIIGAVIGLLTALAARQEPQVTEPGDHSANPGGTAADAATAPGR
jgi:H+/Cl- antiporter ClcA